MKIIANPQVREYLKELSQLLYDKAYFDFEASALKYVDDLLIDIEITLSQKPKRVAPPYFSRYGKNMFYSVFKKSKRTQWYVFFTMHQIDNELVYLIRYISNNHVDAQHF